MVQGQAGRGKDRVYYFNTFNTLPIVLYLWATRMQPNAGKRPCAGKESCFYCQDQADMVAMPQL